ncbi:DMT family transporter [Rhizobium aquaticum]|uniref:DMT family transporter n=1 Tax=Rhizobium aquaticum TaxID=1549636 RepID=UPI003398820B
MNIMADSAANLRQSATPWHQSTAIGYVVLAMVVMVWAGFALTMRAIGASPLAPADVAMIRFAVPLILLLPFTFRRLNQLRKVVPKDALLVLLGGVPFFFIASEGARTTSAAYVGALIAGTTPVAVAILLWCFERWSTPRRQWLPLGLIILGAGGMVVGQPQPVTSETMHGVAFLLVASLVWGAYTIGLKRTGVDAIANGLLISTGSLIVLVVMIAFGLVKSNFGHFTFADTLPFLLVQGVGVGLLSTVGYAFAISRLGAAKSSTIGSLAPAVATLLAIPLLGETQSLATFFSIAIITAGVVLSSRRSQKG